MTLSAVPSDVRVPFRVAEVVVTLVASPVVTDGDAADGVVKVLSSP